MKDASPHAIPTKYEGVQFRSRLEARWAAFFDLCRFPWKYEPNDCSGYIPDFVLFDRMIVEVKPITWGQPAHHREPGFDVAADKVKSACESLRFSWGAIVGVGIYAFGRNAGAPSLASIGRYIVLEPSHGADGLGDLAWSRWRDLQLRWWRDNSELSLEGQPILGSRYAFPPDLELMWREAGNVVQWRAPACLLRENQS